MVSLKQIRHKKRGSQEQLSLASGLSVRTIQRIQAGGKVSTASLKCLTTTLEVEISKLEGTITVIDESIAFAI
jgi:transcriptional regulator with XRE-family HTH domain